ncbi:hypothetical protein QBC43DRAFT_273177 [Cladorrhinum sp. PSN259]|nr:hypothetical protein QBC43DRAFT_273177 [Cladorrhinum sp. PSN259]
MPPSSQPKTQPTRRPVLRFDLEQVSLDDRPNAYKKPQLVLKPQLELPARETYTGGPQPRRFPIWHHFLMVHVKDKADELVKIDLNDFKEPRSLPVDNVPQHSVFCLLPEASIVFRYPIGYRNTPTSLKVTFKRPSDFEAVLSELRKLDIRIAYEQFPRSSSALSYIPSGSPQESEGSQPDKFRQIYNISPPLTASTSSSDHYSSYSGGFPYGYVSGRPPSQPARFPDHGAWSHAVLRSKPPAIIGNPGVLGESGLYKISKVGSSSSSRLRARPPLIPPEHQTSRFYATTNRFRRTLERKDDLQHRQPTSEKAFVSKDHRSVAYEQSDRRFPPGYQTTSLHPRRFSQAPNLGGLVGRTRRPTMQRLDPIHDESDTSPSRSQLNKERTKYASLQPAPAPAPDRMTIIRKDFGELNPTQPETTKLMTQEPNTLQLIQISQIHHQGFLEASMVWNEFMARAKREVKSVDDPEERLRILSKLEPEFTKQWNRAVDCTVQEMQKVQGKGTAPGF